MFFFVSVSLKPSDAYQFFTTGQQKIQQGLLQEGRGLRMTPKVIALPLRDLQGQQRRAQTGRVVQRFVEREHVHWEHRLFCELAIERAQST